MQERSERLIGGLSFLEPLRPDELARAARLFRVVTLEAGETRRLGDGSAEALVVLEGRVAAEVVPLEGLDAVQARLGVGDHLGVMALLQGRALVATVRALTPVRLALLDGAGYETLERDFPVVAIPACAAIAGELSWKDALLREVAAIEAPDLVGDERRAALEARRRRVASRLAGRAARLAPGTAAVRALVKTWLREPAFSMLVGFVGAFGGARLVVGYIYRNQLEHKLFALHHLEGFQNPVHVHHFNYGLILVTIASFLAFFPSFRQSLRALAFVFGLGAGLIFDEFSLIWRLNPSYYEPLSRWAALTVAVLLAQLAFLRGPWLRLLRHLRRDSSADEEIS